VPILKNQRWEIFAQEIAKGETASKAYQTAGFRPSRKNASRLRAREDVGARVHELQLAAARSTEITIASVCRELDDAVAVAKSRGQANAMVSATGLRAKLAGLMVERVEVTASITDTYAACSSVEEIFDLLARDLAGDHELTPTERDGFTKLLIEFFMAIDDYRRGCKAKPSMSAEDRERIERRRLSLASRALNGSAKSVS